MAKLVFKVHGMDCVDEIAILKHEFKPVVRDLEQLQFDLLNGKLSFDADTDLTRESIIQLVARTGMRAEPWEQQAAPNSGGFGQNKGRFLLTIASGGLALTGFGYHVLTAGSFADALGSEGTGIEGSGFIPTVPLFSVLLYLLAIITGTWFVLPKAWRSVVRLRPDMNLLMFVAVVGAAFIGEWFEAATVAFLFSVSLLLESWSVGRARRAIEALLDLAPPTARVRDGDGREIDIAPDDVAIGTIFIVRPGEKIPLDGRVTRGASAVNQASITGESSPVDKQVESEVFAGTINGDGRLDVESTKLAENTTLAKIIRMVGDAQSRRSPSEQWVETFARYYTPAVMLLALLVLVIPPLLLGGAWPTWLYRSLVLLVIACPCALVISTPVSIVAAVAAAARHGVLIKGGPFIEMPSKLRAIAMDKTGTLTHGDPRVVDVAPLEGHSETELMERAAALESQSNHPLARAIVQWANERSLPIPLVDQFEIVPGKGALGTIGGIPFWLGSQRYLEERGFQTTELRDQLAAVQKQGHSIVAIGDDDHAWGFIALADTARPESASILAELHAVGIKNVAMLTGDNWGTANAIAAEVGIDTVHAELLPENKVAIIESLVKKYHYVGMIGDGVNDAPALAASSLGIAMGAVGSDAAIETADIALMADDLSRLPWLIRHSRRTLRTIRQNIGFSLGVKLIFVVLTFSGFASLWAAIAADMGASLLVIFNALRLLRE